MTNQERIDFLRTACSDPDSPIYGSDLVPAILDTCQVAEKAESFLEYAATVRRENTYPWMTRFLIHLSEMLEYMEPESRQWFDIVGADHFVLRQLRKK